MAIPGMGTFSWCITKGLQHVVSDAPTLTRARYRAGVSARIPTSPGALAMGWPPITVSPTPSRKFSSRGTGDPHGTYILSDLCSDRLIRACNGVSDNEQRMQLVSFALLLSV